MATREDWMRRLGPLYGGAVALVHSTPWRWPVEVADEPRSAAWVVALGLPIGAIACIAAAIIHAIGMPSTLAAVVGLATLAVASAGLVEHGVVDRIDRLDARSPTVKSTLALVFVTLARIAALAAVPFERWLAVLVATAVVGRWAAVFLQALGDPIGDEHATATTAGAPAPRSLVTTHAPLWLIVVLGIAAAVLAGIALGAKAAIAALALTAAAAFALGVDAQRRDHGLSAPVVACAAAVGELCVLLLATIT